MTKETDGASYPTGAPAPDEATRRDTDPVAAEPLGFTPIGGSQAAAACGLDPWKSRVRLYLEKRGEIAQSEESEQALWGKLLQPVIADELTARGWQVLPAPADVLTRADHPWMAGHPDGYAKAPPENFNDTRGILEIKTTGGWNAHQWADEGTPTAAVLQVQHYMVLTGLEWALVAGLIGGQRLELRVIERDDKLIDVMLQLESEFWRMVTEGEMPAPDGGEATAEALRRLFPRSVAGSVVALTVDDAKTISDYKFLCESVKETQRQADELKQQLQLRMADNELGLLDGVPRIRWSNVDRKEYTVPAKTYRRFTVL